MASPDEGVGSVPEEAPGATITPRRRGGVATAAVALAVIAGAGVVIYQNIPPWPWFPTPSAAPPAPPPHAAATLAPAAPDAPDPADVTSLLRVARGADGSTTVALDRPVAPHDVRQIQGTDQDLLFRELIRQSVLLAARDERGAATRDELLDDVAPAEGDAAAAEVGSLFRQGFRARMLIRPVAERAVDVEADPILSADLAPRGNQGMGLELVGVMEKLSRTEIPAALDGLGVRGKPSAYRPDAPLPEGVEEKLNTLGLVDHVQALRDLHAAVRSDGESPERLAALARGYAQLGMLTVHHWSAAHRAFEARALLYAERLAAKEANSARSLRVRAFVEALVGVQDAAIKDLKAASEAGGDEPAPAWVKVVDDYVHYKLASLGEAKAPHDRLAALLRMTALEYPGGSRQLIQAARDVVRLDPDCARAFDVICDNGGLGDLHKATVLGPQSFHEFLRGKLAAGDDLPPAVREALDSDAEDAELDEALAAAAGGEPSWGVLAHLARETRFTQVHRRLSFMKKKWNVPVDDFWAAARPSIEGHPYRPFLGLMAGDPDDMAEFVEFAANYDRTDLEPTEWEFVAFMQHTPGPFQAAAKEDWGLALAHTTASARDLSMVLKRTPEFARPQFATRMMQTCPHDPYAASTLVTTQWDAVQPRLAEWKERHGDSAGFLFALVSKLMELDRHDEARPLLARYIIVSPDRWGYERLAECQEKAGDTAGWLETLESYLEDTEDAGLDHATVRVKLARHHLDAGDPAKAKPHADAAAATWAGWAMECAAEVDERLGDLESAGEWRRRAAERYPNSWAQWYLFVVRTGGDDLDDARRFAQAMAARPGAMTSDTAAYIEWSEGRPEHAARLMEEDGDASNPLALAISLALMYDQAGDAAKRDEAAGRIPGLKDDGPNTARLAEMLFGSLADGGEPVDLAAVDAVVDPMPPAPKAFAGLIVGRFLLNRGRPDDARKYLESCVETADMNAWGRAAAASWLRAAFPDRGKPEPPAAAPEAKPSPAEPTSV